ncbi:hypothetical protein V8E53_001845 [Lactarius tabidus]
MPRLTVKRLTRQCAWLAGVLCTLALPALRRFIHSDVAPAAKHSATLVVGMAHVSLNRVRGSVGRQQHNIRRVHVHHNMRTSKSDVEDPT